MTDTTEVDTATKQGAKRPRRMAREPKAEAAGSNEVAVAATSAKHESKADRVLSLLQRPGGATIDQLVAATGWLPHTTRAAMTGLKKKGHAVTSEKLDGLDRVYRVAAD